MFLDSDTVIVAVPGTAFPEGLFDRQGQPLLPGSTPTMGYEDAVPREARALLLVNPTAGQLAAVAAGAPADIRVLVLVDVVRRDMPFSVV
ncbi:hypothetical protein [Pseudocowpox virus]|uniref:Uncharacterized protein n=1 Tax=Pseudocowpox virus TaxID=129726 RepID=D3IZA9_9POXV|nr:hypothetical protein [Pseudocowpox virus]